MSFWLILGMIVFGLVAYWFVSRSHNTDLDQQVYRRAWQQILNRLKDKQTLSLAIIEADKLLDQALKESRFKGSTMAERLVSAGKTFSNKDNVWNAHKLRNQLVHETNVKLSLPQTKRALKSFYKGLKDLGAL